MYIEPAMDFIYLPVDLLSNKEPVQALSCQNMHGGDLLGSYGAWHTEAMAIAWHSATFGMH